MCGNVSRFVCRKREVMRDRQRQRQSQRSDVIGELEKIPSVEDLSRFVSDSGRGNGPAVCEALAKLFPGNTIWAQP